MAKTKKIKNVKIVSIEGAQYGYYFYMCALDDEGKMYMTKQNLKTGEKGDWEVMPTPVKNSCIKQP